VALHHAGGQMKTNPRGDTRFVNEGILIKYLDKFISGFLPA
jgi:hypothetical protein